MNWRKLFQKAPKRFGQALADDAVWGDLLSACPVLRRLPGADLAALRQLATDFLSSKDLEGVQGLALQAGMAARVAVWACLPVLRLGLSWYDDWNNLFICPGGFSDTRRRYEPGGAITEWEDELAGEVLELGPVVLSWKDVLQAGTGSGYNVVIHEMAHKLDARNGELDGAPPLPAEAQAAWRSAFRSAWEELCRMAAHPRRPGHGRQRLPMDDYACESPEEFFAVACENFFERPLGLKAAWPVVYDCMVNYFRLDPAAWI